MTNEDIEIGSKESLCIQLDGGIAPPELLSCIAAVPHVLGMLGQLGVAQDLLFCSSPC